MKLIIGLLIGFAVGFFCNYSGIPVPAPPALLGVALVASMTVGHLLTDKYLEKKASGGRS